MLAESKSREFYQALLDRDSTYDGSVFYGIKSTGIFCRSICPAKKPRFENCEFFETSQQALLAGYRACKRCHPLSMATGDSQLVKQLIAAVETEPERRWKENDLREMGFDVSTVRRQFRRRFGMTFVAFARARRVGRGLERVRAGNSKLEAQLTAGFESPDGFRSACEKLLTEQGVPRGADTLHAEWIETPLGSMVAIAGKTSLHLLEFVDRRGLERELERLRARTKSVIVPGSSGILVETKQQLLAYFDGNLRSFSLPLELAGTSFQCTVWRELLKIPLGQSRSYKQQAIAVGKQDGVRAVAGANGANRLAIVIPCHRVVGSDGKLTGYGGGLARKRWLLEHEQRVAAN